MVSPSRSGAGKTGNSSSRRELTATERRARRWSTAQLKRIPGRLPLSDEHLAAILAAPGLSIDAKRRPALVNALEKAAWWYAFQKTTQQNPQRQKEIDRAQAISDALKRAIARSGTDAQPPANQASPNYLLDTQIAGWLATRAIADDDDPDAFSVAFTRACNAFDEMRWVQEEMAEWARDLALRDGGRPGKKALQPLRIEAIRTLGPYYQSAYGRTLGLSVTGPGTRFLTQFFAAVGDRPGAGRLKDLIAEARKLNE
jgi:hypothetical protein